MPFYADIILPLALPKRTYTYAVPDSLRDLVMPGVRVEVQFGRSRLYSGLVEKTHEYAPEYAVKPVISVLDEVSMVTRLQLELWEWMAQYYCSTLGEVMSAALPGRLKLSSETRLVRNENYGDDFSDLDDDEYLISEALLIQQEISVEDARKILNKKTVFPVIQRLLNRGVLFFREDLQEKYQARKVTGVRIGTRLRGQENLMREVFDELQSKDRQLEIMMAFLVLEKSRPFVRKRELIDKAEVSESSLRTLVKKGILELYDQEVSRLGGFGSEVAEADTLTAQQERALTEIDGHFDKKSVVLLSGVTGSGKTRVYVELIQRAVREGGQALYLLPEIALTTQIISRLQKVFGDDVVVYHSKINSQERVEVWKAAQAGKPVILAARSGLFLPFKNLKLIVVDEEHDPSFKQYDPAPRYHARDSAVYLAGLYGAKTLLGTATPSLETWHNVLSGKYGLVEMRDRFSGVEMPEVSVVDLREQLKTRQMQSIFSKPLLDKLAETISRGEQAILFQNRRGYAPVLKCEVCDWNAMCKHCDVSLTYHKLTNRLRCHYCGYTDNPALLCPACGSGKISLKGFGTEKIEDELKLFLPEARIARMDMDTAGARSGLIALLNDFEERRIDILVGTQMVTKGLDFENVGFVGVLAADSLTRFPDFRAGERAFQLLTQVAGRAGRKKKRGQVLIQAYDPQHPVIQEVLNHDFDSFVQRELAERQEFHYPPYYRLIQLELRHKDPQTVNAAAAYFAAALRDKLGDRVLGPVIPNIARVRGFFGQDIMLKLEKSAGILNQSKQLIRHVTEILNGKQGFSQVTVSVDVDPMG
ncbi:MAG: primosomal protein N' [Saprospiraceae bacterium]|nr:primosomal protein N' [Saprospiraceae bacterium]